MCEGFALDTPLIAHDARKTALEHAVQKTNLLTSAGPRRFYRTGHLFAGLCQGTLEKSAIVVQVVGSCGQGMQPL